MEKVKVKIPSSRENDSFVKRINGYEVNISKDILQLVPIAYRTNSSVELKRDDYEMLNSLGLTMEVIENDQNKDEKGQNLTNRETVANNLDENPIRDDEKKNTAQQPQQKKPEEQEVQEEPKEQKTQQEPQKEQTSREKEGESSEKKPFTAETEEEKKKQEEIGNKFDEQEAPKLREDLEKQGKKPEEIKEAIDQAKTEYIGQYYYLTSDTILESLQKVNGGSFWNYLRANDMQDAVERAYRGCVWPSELGNPDFLEKVIADYMPAGNQIDKTGLKHIHTMALARTYVGYQLEEVSPSGEKAEDGKNEGEVAVISLPEAVDKMPESLKDEVRNDAYINMTKIIQDVMNNNDKYTAISALVPMDNVFAEALEMTEKQYNEKEPTGGKKVAIVQAMDYTKGYRDQLKKDSHGFNINFAIGDINWQNPEERANTIELIRMISDRDDFKGAADEHTVKNADVFFVIRSQEDVLQLRTTKNELESVGANVRINYVNAAPPDKKQEIEKSIKTEVGIDARPVGLKPMVAKNNDLLTAAIGATLVGAGLAFAAAGQKSEEQIKIDEKVQKSSIDKYADDLESGAINKDYATYLLAMEANIPFDIAEQELFEAYMTAHEEAEMGMNRGTNSSEENQ